MHPSDRKIRVCRAGLKKSLLGLEVREKFFGRVISQLYISRIRTIVLAVHRKTPNNLPKNIRKIYLQSYETQRRKSDGLIIEEILLTFQSRQTETHERRLQRP